MHHHVKVDRFEYDRIEAGLLSLHKLF